MRPILRLPVLRLFRTGTPSGSGPSAREARPCAARARGGGASARSAVAANKLLTIAISIASAIPAVSAPDPAAAGPSAPPAASGSAVPARAAAADSASRAALAAAREALRKAVVYHRDARDLALEFSASVYNAALDRHDRYQGRLLLKGKDKFRLEIPGGTYVSDGKEYWEYHKKTGQAILKEAGAAQGRAMPADVLLRFLDADPLAASKVEDAGRKWLELRLDPAGALDDLDSLAVRLDPATFALHQVSSRDQSGNEAVYTVASIARDRGIPPKSFDFAPPKGVEVVDMRGE